MPLPNDQERTTMETVPNWLTDAVYAAGMTAYADDLYPKVAATAAPSLAAEDGIVPPLH